MFARRRAFNLFFRLCLLRPGEGTAQGRTGLCKGLIRFTREGDLCGSSGGHGGHGGHGGRRIHFQTGDGQTDGLVRGLLLVLSHSACKTGGWVLI